MKDATHITIVMDRTGSMAEVRDDAEGAVNHFLTEQKAIPGDCWLYLVDFDSDQPQRVVHDGPIAEMGTYRLEPRNSTPLIYAVGKAIDNTGERLAAIPEDERPDKIIFVIQTDGQENYSHHMREHPYTWEHVREMIKTQQEQFNWQILFLGMGPDSWGQGDRLGIRLNTTAAATGASHGSTQSVLSAYAGDYRSGTAADMSRARGMRVNSVGRVTNEDGEEIDPATGKPIKQ